MEIFANWIFWVSLASIIFLFALIGYLSDNKRKKKESDSSYVKPQVDPIENESSESLADNSNVAAPVEPGSTLNLDNGTWNNNADESEVQTISADSFDNPFVSPTTEEVTGLDEQPASDLFGGLPSSEDSTPVEDTTVETSDVNVDNLSEGEVNTVDVQPSNEFGVFDQPMGDTAVENLATAENADEKVTPLVEETPAEEVTPLVEETSTEEVTPLIDENANTTKDSSENAELWKF